MKPAAALSMKSAALYRYEAVAAQPRCLERISSKHAAYFGAFYTLHISILVLLLYAWRLDANARSHDELEDVYYGVQIAYIAIISTQFFMVGLSLLLFYAIHRETASLIVPWVVGCITFTALESMAIVYSNVLRDHVNKQFDSLCKVEVSFFISRAIMNAFSLWGVMRFYHMVRIGRSWTGVGAIEL